jgi:type I restriction enzyme, R subunit
VAEALAARAARPPAGKTFGVVNPSERILLMIDEAHRTQSSDLGDNMFEAFPNATRIAFTGTPLITERTARRTVKRFGEYIDTYKLMDAVHDGTTLQILYEGRTADTALKDKHGFDTKFEDLFKRPQRGRDPRHQEEVRRHRRHPRSREAHRGHRPRPGRHYVDNILPDGFKAQVVCHSKLAAVRYQKAIREALAERVGERALKPEAGHWTDRRIAFPQGGRGGVLGRHQRAGLHHRGAQGGQALERGGELLQALRLRRPGQGADRHRLPDRVRHAADRLRRAHRAGDVHRQALREHNLLQAIARVNRVKNKQRGFIVDYIGLANHLTEALSIYAGEDAQDIQQG